MQQAEMEGLTLATSNNISGFKHVVWSSLIGAFGATFFSRATRMSKHLGHFACAVDEHRLNSGPSLLAY
jgi:hypothetical protein